MIADAVITSGLKVVAVDPGVFTATLSRKQIVPTQKKEKNKILAVVGSVNPNTTVQMEELWLSQRTHNVFVKTRELLESDERRELEIARVTKEILDECDRNVISTVTGDGIYPENRIDFAPYMERYQCSLDAVSYTHLGVRRSLISLIKVVFPLPFGPRRPMICPRSNERFKLFKA